MKFFRGALAATLLAALLVFPSAMQATATGLSYTSCTPSQQSTITTAMTDAATYAANAVQYFSNNRAGDRYTYWFGTYDSTRWVTVKDNYEQIKTELASNNLDFDCSAAQCTPSTVGFVYPTAPRPFSISLCNAFWSATATGTDSRAGTLIHFLSQFTPIAGAASYAYGQTDAHSLALTNTSQAILNADNYEYFAENNPVTADAASASRITFGNNYFGNQTLGSSSSAEIFTIANTGEAALVVTSLAVTGEFSITNDACRSRSIAVSASCTFTVVFNPQTIGSSSGIVTIVTNAPIALTQVIVTGTGSEAATTTTTSTTIPVAAVSATSSTTTTIPTTTSTTHSVAPTLRATSVRAKATSNASKLTITIGKVTDQLSRKFTVQVKRGKKWVAVRGTFSTSRKTASKVLDLAKGTYRIVVEAVVGFAPATSAGAQLLR